MVELPFPSRASIRSAQLENLQRLLRIIVPANRFYAAKFRKAGVEPVVESLEDFSARFPFTTKQELIEDQQAHPPLGTNLTFPAESYTRYHQTSGTTGTPIRWLDTAASWDAMVERWIEIFRAAGATPKDRVAFAFSFGPFIGFWLAFEAAARLGALCLPAGGLSSGARLRLILDMQATVLCCTPTYALRLAEVAEQEGIDLAGARVKTIIVAGEPGGSIPATRARLESLWPGARVFDHHGMTETGPVTYECPAQPGFLHVMESGFLAEIVDPPSGAPVPPGQQGELVLTTLLRTGSPLIRYRTGDVVKLATNAHDPASEIQVAERPCACGRYELALEGGIIGRTDDMLIVRGVNIYPSAVEHLLRACGGIAEYQVAVSQNGSLAELSLTIEPEPACRNPKELVARLERGFQQTFALRVPIKMVGPGSLPRFEMKAKRWVKS